MIKNHYHSSTAQNSILPVIDASDDTWKVDNGCSASLITVGATLGAPASATDATATTPTATARDAATVTSVTPATTTVGDCHVSNGQIPDPSGNVFHAHGINAGPWNIGQATPDAIQSLFPSLNFVRLNTAHNNTNGTLTQQEAYVKSLTDRGIVVEVEDHQWPTPGVFTGSTLQSENNWFAQWANDCRVRLGEAAATASRRHKPSPVQMANSAHYW